MSKFQHCQVTIVTKLGRTSRHRLRIPFLVDNDCDCGQRQTMNHIVDTCPLTTSEGGKSLLDEADDDAVIWLESTATAALAK